MTMTINGTSGLVFNDASTQATAATGFGFKNRLINGAMMIDQRNAGASVTFPSGGNNVYTLDRWVGFKQLSTGGSFTVARSSVAPAGFVNSALVTITSSATDTGNGVNALTQFIEGLNVADLGWGTANAQPVTLSFWVRSSVTGTYSCSLNNDGYDYSYVANYTITSANTWEQKTITIVGPTSGTWLTTNGAGIRLWFDLGTGTGRNGTAGSWVASQIYRTAGSVQLLANNGATFYITGVQLEKGSTATSFDYRPYGTELALCQRYFEKSYNSGDALGASSNYTGIAILQGSTDGSSNAAIGIRFQVPKRTNATMTYYNADSGASGTWAYSRSGASGTFTTNSDQPSQNGVNAYGAAGASWVTVRSYGHWAASAEL